LTKRKLNEKLPLLDVNHKACCSPQALLVSKTQESVNTQLTKVLNVWL